MTYIKVGSLMVLFMGDGSVTYFFFLQSVLIVVIQNIPRYEVITVYFLICLVFLNNHNDEVIEYSNLNNSALPWSKVQAI